ncbi:MAG: hypothetical protein ACRD4L_01490, partial [Pyrinomonadaceae bacterium]
MKVEQAVVHSINRTLHPNTLRALLSGSLDYAGLFPPAQLSMSEAVGEFAKYLLMEESWMLGRFVMPISRLGEFETEFAHLKELNSECRETLLKAKTTWRISVISGTDIEKDLSVIDDFNIRQIDDCVK